MSFFVKFWGVRGSIPTPGHRTRVHGGNTSCVEIRIGDTLFICDGGTGLRELGLDLIDRGKSPVTGHILFSHTHWDHIQGFPFFVPVYIPGNTFYVYGPGPGDQTAYELLSGQMASSYFPVDFAELGANIVSRQLQVGSTTIEDVKVSIIEQKHPGSSYGFKFESSGTTAIYATDIELDLYLSDDGGMDKPAEAHRSMPEDLVAFARGADLLIADAQYTEEEYPNKIGWGHARATTSVDWAIAAGVKTLALYHHDPMHSDKVIDEIVTTCRQRVEAAESNLKVFAAREGLELKLT